MLISQQPIEFDENAIEIEKFDSRIIRRFRSYLYEGQSNC